MGLWKITTRLIGVENGISRYFAWKFSIFSAFYVIVVLNSWLHISTLFHHAGKLYMKRLHSIYNTLVIKNIIGKAFYFLLLHMFTQYLLLLLPQAVLYYFKKSSLSSGNYVCCLYSHLICYRDLQHQPDQMASDRKHLFSTQHYRQLPPKRGRVNLSCWRQFFPIILTWKINSLPVVKGFGTGTIVFYFLCISIFTTKSGY